MRVHSQELREVPHLSVVLALTLVALSRGNGVFPNQHPLGCRVLTMDLIMPCPQLSTATTAVQNGQQGTCIWPEPRSTAED